MRCSSAAAIATWSPLVVIATSHSRCGVGSEVSRRASAASVSALEVSAKSWRTPSATSVAPVTIAPGGSSSCAANVDHAGRSARQSSQAGIASR